MFSWSLLAANIFVELAQELLAGLINSVGKTSRNNSISFFFFLLGIREIFQFAFPRGCRAERSEPGAHPVGPRASPRPASAAPPPRLPTALPG